MATETFTVNYVPGDGVEIYENGRFDIPVAVTPAGTAIYSLEDADEFISAHGFTRITEWTARSDGDEAFEAGDTGQNYLQPYAALATFTGHPGDK